MIINIFTVMKMTIIRGGALHLSGSGGGVCLCDRGRWDQGRSLQPDGEPADQTRSDQKLKYRIWSSSYIYDEDQILYIFKYIPLKIRSWNITFDPHHIFHCRDWTTTAPKDGSKTQRRGTRGRVPEGGEGVEGGLDKFIINITFVIIIIIKVGCGREVKRHGGNPLHQQVEQGPRGAHHCHHRHHHRHQSHHHILCHSLHPDHEVKLVQKMQSDDSSAGSREIQENSSYPTGRFVSQSLGSMMRT